MRGRISRLAESASVIANATRAKDRRPSEPLGNDPDAKTRDEFQQIAAERPRDIRDEVTKKFGEQEAE